MSNQDSLNYVFFYGIVLLTVILGYCIKSYKLRYATEGSVALVLGALAGGIICFKYLVVQNRSDQPKKLIAFDDNMFFEVLLPPIIFSAGFNVKKKLFFQNFLTVVVLGVFGTMWSCFFVTSGTHMLMQAMNLPRRHLFATALALGAIFSCTDSVASLQVLDKDSEPLLHSLLFGEGVVNDATAIVLLSATKGLAVSESLSLQQAFWLLAGFARLFLLSLVLGLAVGMLSALVVRWVFSRSRRPECEVLVVGLLGFIAYFLAEVANLSAILTVFFCGIAMSHYTWHNLGPTAQVITRQGFSVVASLCEIVLFVYSGLDMWLTALWPNALYSSWQSLEKIIVLAVGTLVIVLCARAAFVFPICWLADRGWLRRSRLGPGGAAILWWGGLPRGAITLALTYHTFLKDAQAAPENQVIIAASITVVALTTVGFGAATGRVMETLLRWKYGPGGGGSIMMARGGGRGGGAALARYSFGASGGADDRDDDVPDSVASDETAGLLGGGRPNNRSAASSKFGGGGARADGRNYGTMTTSSTGQHSARGFDGFAGNGGKGLLGASASQGGGEFSFPAVSGTNSPVAVPAGHAASGTGFLPLSQKADLAPVSSFELTPSLLRAASDGSDGPGGAAALPGGARLSPPQSRGSELLKLPARGTWGATAKAGSGAAGSSYSGVSALGPADASVDIQSTSSWKAAAAAGSSFAGVDGGFELGERGLGDIGSLPVSDFVSGKFEPDESSMDTSWIHRKWRYWDSTYLQPVFGGSSQASRLVPALEDLDAEDAAIFRARGVGGDR